MRILLVTQDEPFFLADNIRHLISNLSRSDEVVGCVLLSPSPFGRKDNFLKKTFKTYRIFGFNFVLYYGIQYVISIFKTTRKVVKVLNDFSVPIIQLNKSINCSDSLEQIKSYNPELIISILGNEVFKDEIISLPTKGCINLHTSLLPKYRGLMPTFWVLKNSEKETGISVFYMDRGIDSGPIIVQERIPIPNGYSQQELITLTKKMGMDAILKAVSLIASDNVKTIPNNSEQSTYYSMPTRDDVRQFIAAGKRFY